jgi:hypothetical protein
MSSMVRKQIYISADQESLLKQRAQELGTTESALIRWGIDQSTRFRPPPAEAEAAWQDALTFMRERARIDSAKRERGWTREDLYDRPTGHVSD